MSNLLKKGIVPVIIIRSIMDSDASETALQQYHIDPAPRINVAQPLLPARTSVIHLPLPAHHRTLSVNVNQLKNYPALVEQALLSSLLTGNEQGTALLLPVFKQQQPQHIFYISWGDAVIARSHGRHAQAAALYRRVLAIQPQATAAQLQLAVTLYENYDNRAAEREFMALKQYAAKEPVLEKLTDRYLQALHNRSKWKFSGKLNYLDDNNVNNAPAAGTRIGHWTTSAPESAKGAGYYASARKKIPLTGNFWSATEIYGYGRYYPDNHKYDEATIRTASGISYYDAGTEISLLPFFEQSWYAGGYSAQRRSLKRYHHTYGGRAEINQRVSHRWLISAAAEYGSQKYISRDYLTNKNILFSALIQYVPEAGRYLFAGSDYYQENTSDKDSAFRRKSIRFGWGERWGRGLSSSVTGSYARRSYFTRDFFGIKRNNNEYTLMTSLWHDNINLLGFTPVLVWSYSKNGSNHPFYRYEKNRLYVEIERKLP